MEIICRPDSSTRKHYLSEKGSPFKIKPKLLYVGKLSKKSLWKDNPHCHTFAEIVFITKGIGTVCVANNDIELRDGDVVIYNAGVEHCEKSSLDNPLEMYFIAYDNIGLLDLEKNTLVPEGYPIKFASGEMFGVLKEYFELLIHELTKKEIFFNEVSQNTAKTLLMYFYRLINSSFDTSSLLSSNPQFTKAIEYIDLHFKEEFTIEDIAQKFFINMYYLSHLFKASKKTSIKNYIIQKRLDKAKTELLGSNTSVSQICYDVGFNNLNYFCRLFKKRFGITPLMFRKTNKAQ